MFVIFRHMLIRLRGPILGFGLALCLLAWPLLSAYEVVQREQEKIRELVQSYSMFITGLGGDMDNFASAESYLSMRYFSMLPLILGVFAVMAGTGLLASDEENGTLDLILAHPVSRTSLFLGRWLAYMLALVLILLITWMGLASAARQYVFPVEAFTLVRPFLALLAVVLYFGNLALLLSMVLPSRRLATSTAVLFLVGSFFLTMLARIDPGLKPFAFLSPLEFYQSGEAIRGLNLRWFAGLMGGALLWAGLAWWCFERRDIRVAGEGVWRWPLLSRRPA
jgi:ABC-2 type transport system permease protein